MQYRRLGSSGLMVSPLCFGTMLLGSPVEEGESIRLVHAALDLGVNFIDTANMYEGYKRFLGSPGGITEDIVGKALRGRRDRAVLVTKVASPIGPGPQDRGLSATHILRELENSLRRLQTDFINVYLMHWPDKETPLETTLEAMAQAVRQGKIRHYGASNHRAWQLCEMLWISDRKNAPRPSVSQIPISMLRREMQPDLPFGQKYDIGVMAYAILQGGLLSGKYRRGQPPPADSRAVEKPQWIWKTNDALFDRLEGIEALARELGVTPAQYALAWTVAQPGITAGILGIKKMEQLQEAAAAQEVRIPEAHFAKIDALSPPPPKQEDPVRG